MTRETFWKITGAAILLVMAWIIWSDRPDGAGAPSRRPAELLAQDRRVDGLFLVIGADRSLQRSLFMSYEPLRGQCQFWVVPPYLALAEDAGSPADKLPPTLASVYGRDGVAAAGEAFGRHSGIEPSFIEAVAEEDLYRLINLMGGVRLSVMSPLVSSDGRDRVEVPAGDAVFLDGVKARQYLEYHRESAGARGQLIRGEHLFHAAIGRMRDHLDVPWFQAELGRLFARLSADSRRALLGKLITLTPDAVMVNPLPGRQNLSQGIFYLSAQALRERLPGELQPEIARGAPQQRITVQLLNGCGRTGLSEQARDYFEGAGDVDIVETGNADHFKYQQTVIIDRSGNLRSAERVREILGTGVLRRELASAPLVDVTVILGPDAAALTARSR